MSGIDNIDKALQAAVRIEATLDYEWAPLADAKLRIIRASAIHVAHKRLAEIETRRLSLRQPGCSGGYNQDVWSKMLASSKGVLAAEASKPAATIARDYDASALEDMEVSRQVAGMKDRCTGVVVNLTRGYNDCGFDALAERMWIKY